MGSERVRWQGWGFTVAIEGRVQTYLALGMLKGHVPTVLRTRRRRKRHD
jgi:hypothetical protein